MRRTLAVIALLLLTGCGSAVSRGGGLTSPVRPAVRLTVIGDSISAGYYASAADQAFPELVARRMRGAGQQVAPTVISQAGATTADALRWHSSIASDVVIVELGTNDWGSAVPVDLFTARYHDLLGKVRGGSPRARLICMGSWTGGADQNAIGQPAQRYDLAIAKECAARGGAYVELTGVYGAAANHGPVGAPSFLGPSDWFHPNDAGHAAIADVVLTRVLGRATPSATGAAGGDATGAGDAVRVVSGGG